MSEYICGQCNAVFTVDDSVPPRVCPVCGANTVSSSVCELPPDSMLGCFKVIRKIGEGNTGIIYLASQKSVEREVALKVLFRDLTVNPDVAKQFLDGVRALAQIHHPNIVCAYEAGSDRGYLFLAMQYVDGKTIESYLHEGESFTPGRSVEIIRAVVTALQFVWEQYQICHRDIKPGNIILSRMGVPMILDFGIALPRGADPLQDGQIEGTPYYMSPEQIRGEKQDFASDMYSLGATFYHMLAGRPPYDSEDLTKILEMHCNKPFPVPDDVKIPPEILKILKRMMAKGAADRYASWDELLKELSSVATPSRADKEQNVKKKPQHQYKPVSMQIPTVSRGGSAVLSFFFGVILPLIFLFVGGYFWTNYVDSCAKKNMRQAEDAYERAIAFESTAAPVVVEYKKVLSSIQRLGVNKELEKKYNDICQRRISVLNYLLAEKKVSESNNNDVLHAVESYREQKSEFGVNDIRTAASAASLREMLKNSQKISFLIPEFEKKRLKNIRSLETALKDYQRDGGSFAASAEQSNPQRKQSGSEAEPATGEILEQEEE